jgi:phenylalanine-4-hydroxylase
MGATELHTQCLKAFTPSEHETWRVLFGNLAENRGTMAHPIFAEGLEKLGISGDRIPDLDEVNRRLFRLTGWRGVPVAGLESGHSFYPALAERKFPIGNFIRAGDSLGYTPAPDIFHDLYGHIPFYANREYADFCQSYGSMASRYLGNPLALVKIERFFWFTVEFGLSETERGRRILGAGILSSRDESIYALSDKPEILPFDVERICNQAYRIDQIQPRLFVLKDPDQLYGSLQDVEKVVRRS